MTEPKIRFDVEANATGAAEVERLAQTFVKLDDAVDPALATRAEAAANALRQIGEQQGAISTFERLSVETENAVRDVANAAQKLEDFRAKLVNVAEPTSDQAGRLEKLQDKLQKTEAALSSKGAALNEARGKLEQFGIPLDRVSAKQAELRTELESTRNEVQQLGEVAATARGFEALASQTEEARVAVARTRSELDAYAAKLSGLDEITDQQAQALQALGAAAARAEGDFQRASQAQAEAARETRAAGVDVDAITAAQQRARAATLAAAEAARSAAAAQLSAAQTAADAAREQSTAIAQGAKGYTDLVAATEEARISVAKTASAFDAFSAKLAGLDEVTDQQTQALKALQLAAQQAQADFVRAAQAQADAGDRMRATGVDVDAITAAQQRARAATLASAEAARSAAADQLRAAQDKAAAAKAEVASATSAAAQYQKLVEATEDARLVYVRSRAALEEYRTSMANVATPTRAQVLALQNLEIASNGARVALLNAEAAQERASASAREAGVNVNALTAAMQRSKAAAVAAAEAHEQAAITARTQSSATDGMAGSAQSAGTAMGAMKGALGQLTAAFGAYEAGRFAINAVADLDALRRSLTQVTGSAETAARQIDFLRNLSQEAGVSISAIQEPFGRFVASMSAAGISLQTTNQAFSSVTKAAGVLGLSAEETGGALLALSQMASKGKVSMEELSSQLGERLPAVLATTAKGLGLSTAELTKLVESGKLLADEEFFAAFARSVDKTFVEGSGKISGMRAEWGRLTSTMTEAVQVLGDGALGKGAGAALGALAETLKYLTFVATLVGESFTTTGQKIGAFIGALVSRDFSQLSQVMDEIQQKSDDRLTGLVARMQGIATGFEQSGNAARKAGADIATSTTGVQQGAQALADNANAAQGAAQAQGALRDASTQTAAGLANIGTAARQAAAGTDTLTSASADVGRQAGGTAVSWAQLMQGFSGSQEVIRQVITQKSELVKASKAEGDTLLQVAAITGDESAKREAAVMVSQKQAIAANELAAAQAALLDSRRAELQAMEEYVARNGDASGARSKQIDQLREEVKETEAKTRASQAEASQMDLLAQRRKLESDMSRDNSSRLGELRRAYEESKQSVEAYRILLERGAISQDQFNRKMSEASTVSALYRDALADVRANMDLKIRSEQADLQLSGARLTAERAATQASIRTAEAAGNEAAATDAKVQGKWQEIRAIEAGVQGAQLAYQASLNKIDADREELISQGKLTTQKEEELDIRRRAAEAKLIEAKAGQQNVSAIMAEIDALQRRAGTRPGGGGGGGNPDDNPGGNDNRVGVVKYNKDGTYTDSNGVRRNRAGNDVNTYTSLGSMQSMFQIQQKMAAGTLTKEDIELARKALGEVEFNAAWQRSMMSVAAGSVSIGAQLQTQQAELAAKQALERLQSAGLSSRVAVDGAQGSLGRRQNRQQDDAQTTADADTSAQIAALRAELAASQAQQRASTPSNTSSNTGATSSSHTITLNLGGRNTTINTASESDSQALMTLLRQLETAASVTSVRI